MQYRAQNGQEYTPSNSSCLAILRLRGASLHFQSFALNAPTNLLTNRATTLLP